MSKDKRILMNLGYTEDWANGYLDASERYEKQIAQLKAENLELLREIAIGKKEAEKR